MNRRTLGLSLLLFGATCLAYWPAYHGQFIWDDDRYVWQNTLLRSAHGLGRIWTDIGATPQYYPLTHTVFWLEWHGWGDHVLGYHIVNVLLHVVASLVVVRLLKALRMPGAWLAGFVFALHPLHVESVAWISELKNTLSIVFLLLSMLTYASYAGLRERANRNRSTWALALIFFLAAVLSKTVSSSMPAVMLVLIWWKRGRIRWADVRPLLPFFAVAIVATVITGRMERVVVGAEGHDWDFTFAQRLLIAARALWWYAGHLVFPSRLAFSYTRWTIDVHAAWQWAYVAATVLMFAILIAFRRLGRAPLAATLIFCGTLFPALGFFNLFPQRYSFVADHFQYASDIALIALFAEGLTILGRRFPSKLRHVWVVVLIGFLSVATFSQARIYSNEEVLWRDTIAKTPTSWLAHNDLAIWLMNTHDPAKSTEALHELQETLRLRPQHDRAHWSMGDLLMRMGRPTEANQQYDLAIQQYRNTIAADPRATNAYLQLAELYDALGRTAEAADTYRMAAANRPDESYFLQQAAQHEITLGNPTAAIDYLQQWAALRPDSIEPRVRLAYLEGSLGRVMDARLQLQQAAKIDPENPDVKHGFDLVQTWMSHPTTSSR